MKLIPAALASLPARLIGDLQLYVEANPSMRHLNNKTRRDLGLRLKWLFDTGRLPPDLHDLATCIKEDGNAGAHAGSLGRGDADDLIDFAEELLNRLFTEPERVRLKKIAQAERKAGERKSK